EDAVDLRRDLQQAIEQVRVVGVDCTGAERRTRKAVEHGSTPQRRRAPFGAPAYFFSSRALRWPVLADFSPANGFSLRIIHGYFGHLPSSHGWSGWFSCRT